jgi:hypothetical protein
VYQQDNWKGQNKNKQQQQQQQKNRMASDLFF